MPLHSGSTEHAKYYSSALKLCPPIASWLNADVLKRIKTTHDTMFLQYTSSSLKVHEGGGGVAENLTTDPQDAARTFRSGVVAR